MKGFLREAIILDEKKENIDLNHNNESVKYFANGYIFLGDFNRIGFFKLLDGTCLQGLFIDSILVNGRIEYYNGVIFEGMFHPSNGALRSGKLKFTSGIEFVGDWDQKGKTLSGVLKEKNYVSDVFDKSKSLYSHDKIHKIKFHQSSISFITYQKSNNIKTEFILGCSDKMFYCFHSYKCQQLNGLQRYVDIYNGFETIEVYNNGRPTEKWSYLTSKGFRYVLDTLKNKKKIDFPFLFNGKYKGTFDVWCSNVKLFDGVLKIINKPDNENKNIRVIKPDNLANFVENMYVIKDTHLFLGLLKRYKSIFNQLCLEVNKSNIHKLNSKLICIRPIVDSNSNVSKEYVVSLYNDNSRVEDTDDKLAINNSNASKTIIRCGNNNISESLHSQIGVLDKPENSYTLIYINTFKEEYSKYIINEKSIFLNDNLSENAIGVINIDGKRILQVFTCQGSIMFHCGCKMLNKENNKVSHGIIYQIDKNIYFLEQ